MQVYSRKLGETEKHGKSRKWYMEIGIAIIMVAILVAIAILSTHQAVASPHQVVASSLIGQHCFPRGAHMCFFHT
jgi:hypothetical protein